MYLSPADLRDKVAPDNEGRGTAAELPDDQLAAAIQEAQDRVNAYTGEKYEDATVPGLVKSLTMALAIYFATLTYRKSNDLAQFDPVYLRYQDALTVLKDIRSGAISVTVPTNTDPQPGTDVPKIINPNGDATAFTKRDFGLAVRTGTHSRLVEVAGWYEPW